MPRSRVATAPKLPTSDPLNANSSQSSRTKASPSGPPSLFAAWAMCAPYQVAILPLRAFGGRRVRLSRGSARRGAFHHRSAALKGVRLSLFDALLEADSRCAPKEANAAKYKAAKTRSLLGCLVSYYRYNFAPVAAFARTSTPSGARSLKYHPYFQCRATVPAIRKVGVQAQCSPDALFSLECFSSSPYRHA